MKKLILLTVCAVAMAIIPSCIQGQNSRIPVKIVVQERSVPKFHGISTSAGIDVFLQQGSTQNVKLKAAEDVMNYVETKVDKGVLHIYYKGTKTHKNMSCNVYVTATEIDLIKAQSGADVKVEGILTGDNLNIDTSSAGDVKAVVKYDKLTISGSSGADVELKGEATTCTISASSAADISLDQLKCSIVNASASSGADISVYATDHLTASASSGASIKYFGDPRTDISSSSGGRVKKVK